MLRGSGRFSRRRASCRLRFALPKAKSSGSVTRAASLLGGPVRTRVPSLRGASLAGIRPLVARRAWVALGRLSCGLVVGEFCGTRPGG